MGMQGKEAMADDARTYRQRAEAERLIAADTTCPTSGTERCIAPRDGMNWQVNWNGRGLVPRRDKGAQPIPPRKHELLCRSHAASHNLIRGKRVIEQNR
jgi:hypothetical protein